ncbi:MAG: HD domain-containing protein [Candidatus Korarchaeum sp.]
MERVLSYPGEYLANHISLCLCYSRGLKGSRIGKLGSSISCNFEDIVRISIVFHDFGKAFYKEGRGKLSFPGHEVISAYILREYMQKLIEKEPKNAEEISARLNPSLFAVTFHHHPMGLSERIDKLNASLNAESLARLEGEIDFLPEEALSDDERALLREVFEDMRSKMEQGMNVNDVKRTVSDVIERLFGEFAGGKEENVRLKKLSYLSLVTLVSVDYLAAEVRGGSRSVFGDAMREFHRYYLCDLNEKQLSRFLQMWML